MPNPFAPLIAAKARQYGLDPLFLSKVAQTESAFNPGAESPAGALGLMQVMLPTAGDYGVTSRQQLLDPTTNVDVGARHMAMLFNRYQGDPDQARKATAAYNVGQGKVPKGVPFASFFNRLPQETRNYVQKIHGPVTGGASITAPIAVRPPAVSVRTGPPSAVPDQRLFDSIYNYVFGQGDEGPPPAQLWPGPDASMPPVGATTDDLGRLGMLALSGWGGAPSFSLPVTGFDPLTLALRSLLR